MVQRNKSKPAVVLNLVLQFLMAVFYKRLKAYLQLSIFFIRFTVLVEEEPKDQEGSDDDSDGGDEEEEEEDTSSEEDDAMQHLSGFVEINVVTCIKKYSRKRFAKRRHCVEIAPLMHPLGYWFGIFISMNVFVLFRFRIIRQRR